MYASTIRKINLGKNPPVLQCTLCIPKAQVGRCIYLTAMTHLSCKKGGKFIFATLCIRQGKRLCKARLQGCVQGYKAVFQEGGDGIFWKGTFAQAKGNLQKQVSKHILYWGKLAFLCTQGRKDSLCYYIAFPARVIPKWPSALQGSNAERRGIIENPGHSIAQPATTHFFAIKFRFCEKATKIFLDKIFHKIVKKSKQKGYMWFQDIVVNKCLKAGLSEEKLSLMPRLRTLSNVLF